MNTETINEVAQHNDSARARAEERYRELLASDDTTPAQLDEILKALNKTPADAEADVQALKHAASLRQQIEEARGIGQRVEVSARELVEHREETATIVALRKQEYQDLMRAQTYLTNQAEAARRAADELALLEKRHPGVFAR